MKNRIKEIVKKSGLTGEKFGERIGVSQGLVSQMCTGKTKPSDRTIGDICREFGVNEVWLRTGEGDPYLELSREEKIMQMAGRVTKGSDAFKKNMLYMLAQLDEQDWQNLSDIYDKCKEALGK